MGEYTIIKAEEATFTYDNDAVLFDKRNGIFGLGANRYRLTEHGFLKITQGRIRQQSQTFDLRGATYEKSRYNFLLGENTGSIRLNTGDQITIKRLFYRGFREDLDKSIRNAQLEHRRGLNNPQPYPYKTSKAWLVVALIIIVALLAAIFVPKLVNSVHVDTNDIQKTVSETAEKIGNLTIQDIRDAIGTNNLLSEQTYDKILPNLGTAEHIKLYVLLALYITTILIVFPRALKKLFGVVSLIGIIAIFVLSLVENEFLPVVDIKALMPLLIPALYLMAILGSADNKYLISVLSGVLSLAILIGVLFFLAGSIFVAAAIVLAASIVSVVCGAKVRSFTCSWAAFVGFGFSAYCAYNLIHDFRTMSEAQIGQLNLIQELSPAAMCVILWIVAMVLSKIRKKR